MLRRHDRPRPTSSQACKHFTGQVYAQAARGLPAIVTVGQFQSGVRNNIIPDSARLVGTIRTFDDKVQDDIHARVKKIAEGIASGAGATD